MPAAGTAGAAAPPVAAPPGAAAGGGGHGPGTTGGGAGGGGVVRLREPSAPLRPRSAVPREPAARVTEPLGTTWPPAGPSPGPDSSSEWDDEPDPWGGGGSELEARRALRRLLLRRRGRGAGPGAGAAAGPAAGGGPPGEGPVGGGCEGRGAGLATRSPPGACVARSASLCSASSHSIRTSGSSIAAEARRMAPAARPIRQPIRKSWRTAQSGPSPPRLTRYVVYKSRRASQCTAGVSARESTVTAMVLGGWPPPAPDGRHSHGRGETLPASSLWRHSRPCSPWSGERGDLSPARGPQEPRMPAAVAAGRAGWAGHERPAYPSVPVAGSHRVRWGRPPFEPKHCRMNISEITQRHAR